MNVKDIVYYQSMRQDLLEMIPSQIEKVLSVGCGAAVTEGHIKSKFAIPYVVGIELNEQVANLAREVLDELIVGDVENISLSFPKKYFDLIIYADVLEHLRSPWEVLSNHLSYLKDDGYVLISLPNVRYYFVIWQLLLGRWEYQSRGILDRTHLRFFTLREIRQLLNNVDVEIIQFRRNYRLLENVSYKYRKVAKLLSLFVFREFFTYQYIILAQKKKINSKE